MNTHFEILPFPAALLESGEVSDYGGVQEERSSRGMGRAARPSAPRGRPGGKSPARMAYGSGGAAARLTGKMGKAGRTGGFARPQQKWPHRRPHYWPHYWPGGWLGGYGFWPAGVAVYEPDWLAVADAPPGDAPGPDADDGRDDGNSFGNGFGGGGFGDFGENGLGGFSSAG